MAKTAKYGFRSVEGWEPGDRLIDFRGAEAILGYVSRPNSENRSAKVIVDGVERYADVFENPAAEARLVILNHLAIVEKALEA